MPGSKLRVAKQLPSVTTRVVAKQLPSVTTLKRRLHSFAIGRHRTKMNKYGEPVRPASDGMLFDDTPDGEELEPVFAGQVFRKSAPAATQLSEPISTAKEVRKESRDDLDSHLPEHTSNTSNQAVSKSVKSTTEKFDVTLPGAGILGMSFLQGHGQELRVSAVRPGGPVAATGKIAVGMIIHAINGIEVTNDAVLNRLLLSERAKGDFVLSLSQSDDEWQKACIAAKIARRSMIVADRAKQKDKEKHLLGRGKKMMKTIKHNAKLDRTGVVLPITVACIPTKHAFGSVPPPPDRSTTASP